MNPKPRPRIGVTLGDPAGIGPEIVLHMLHDTDLTSLVQPVVYGDLALLQQVAAVTHIAWPSHLCVREAADTSLWPAAPPALLLDFREPALQTIQPGQIQAAAGAAAAVWIRQAVRDALSGALLAIATGPIHKQAFALAGETHPGHTELLTELSGSRQSVMMFIAPDLAVSLATIHIPLAEVPGSLNRERLLAVIGLTADAMQHRLGRIPRIGVLGLNPHSGEGGHFGDAETACIAPAIADAKAQGLDVSGPIVPDTAFVPAHRRRFDAFVAMYHDQALIPFKMLAFDFGVNVTLGLPFIRTSVDHGTAFDIAWQGKASANSLCQAVRLAAALSRERQ